MKRLFFAVISIACSICSYSQDLTEKDFLSQLPRTTDDFQNYQFDYELENLQSHLPSYPLGITSTISSFDGTGIFPIQHVCPVKEIECYLFNKRDEKDILCYAAKAKFATNGQLVEFSGKECYKQQYWYTDKTYSQIEGRDMKLIPCLPNPYITMIKPIRDSKGLITKVGNDWFYDYDSYDRVVQIRHIDDKYSYNYEYLNNTKKITNIKIYISKRIRGEVNYEYANDKITNINGKLFYETGNEGSVEKEFVKTYSYDSKGGVASMTHLEKTPGDSEILYEYTFDNRYDDKGRIVCTNVTKNWKSRTGSYGNGFKQPEEFTRTYTYDDKGNWVKLEDNQGHYIVRKITYKLSMQSNSYDENHVFDEEEVEIRASMGNTLKNLAANGKFMPISEIAEYNEGWPRDLTVNVDFIVEKDGSISNIESGRKGSYIEEGRKAICSFIWTPAMINGKPVRSNVTLSWRFYKVDGQEKFTIIKDVIFTEKERTAYSKANTNIEDRKNKKFLLDLEKEATSGDFHAKRKLALDYLNGVHGEKDLDKALKYCIDVINAKPNDKEIQEILIQNSGHVLSNKSYAQILAKNVNPTIISDDNWNVLRLLAAAECGKKEVFINQIRISKEYKLKSYPIWLIWGANHNDLQSMYELAELYLDSSSGLFDSKMGIELLTKAADAGHPEARYSLGLKYKNGIFVEKDKKKAKMYLNK